MDDESLRGAAWARLLSVRVSRPGMSGKTGRREYHVIELVYTGS